MSTRCHCGLPLHYRDPQIRALVERLIAGAGGDPCVTVTVVIDGVRRSWRVQRHYLALHGLKAGELPTLGFEELPGDPAEDRN